MLKSTPVVRCSIYTRKSTEEGLEQEFNSLHAQREAAEAYIQSQKHLGLVLLAEHYDDGGFTGSNLDRPALQRLLADIEARRVDCVVVYKVDRLSRSLLDFARLVERFDQRSVSFVSVTQQLNTTTSLGRLTLNILLSFAQFEKELVSERTRDKMSAARRKGKWVGGTPVLGYDVTPGGGRLAVNEKEARRVREIFELYAHHGSLSVVAAELERRRWTTKSWISKGGIEHTGRAFTPASLRRLLTNATYAGQVEHRGTIYAGEQVAIVEPALWNQVRAGLETGRQRAQGTNTTQNPLLAGLLSCTSCQRPMIATYTAKRGRRYRYYVCQAARQNGWNSCPTKSVAAGLLEDSVIAQLRGALNTEEARAQLRISSAEWQEFEQGARAGLVRAIVEQIGYEGATGAVVLKLGVGGEQR
jgi:site-specific DNA recombinase